MRAMAKACLRVLCYRWLNGKANKMEQRKANAAL
jgi:hypothetical protein